MSPLTEPDLKISLIRLLKHILYGFRFYGFRLQSRVIYLQAFGSGLNRMKRRN